ncbi:hypothetical protein Gasu2_53350 [Galdieria sulphuraria]|uniref:Uncharacterized protein n=1 Tax=Galdieria sulphuraria TaxID=130081 RepID=M2XYY3_GALSU|nr:uncharacterized protein Gasu_37280 [Galdieria sulphuraria]EME28838.1 hypothetical protein Gasu_37280 [Galdieria sulphuraria]GJD11192.1 hypothetical protein Gasu2_53350 [Galdieria sulphuraria]|eukprot:XP_005705358.1 hypothetical protein Gasu_37280 [Galdieria sulphuraria]
MEESTVQAPSKRRCSVYEVDGFRFRRKKKRTTESSFVEPIQKEVSNSDSCGHVNDDLNNEEKENKLNVATVPIKSRETVSLAKQEEKTKKLYCESISKDQSEEQRLKALCEAVWTEIYKEAIEEKLPEKGTSLRVLEDVRVAFLDQLTWYLDNPEQRSKTVSEISRPNPINLELEVKIKSLEHDLNCYCNELLGWSNAKSILEEPAKDNKSNETAFSIEERAKKIAVSLSSPYQPQLTRLIKEATVCLDINFTELLEICRIVLTFKNQTAERIKNLNQWIYHCSFAGLPDMGNPKKLLKTMSLQ